MAAQLAGRSEVGGKKVLIKLGVIKPVELIAGGACIVHKSQYYRQQNGGAHQCAYHSPQGHLQQSAHSLLGAVPIIQAAQTIDGINGRDDRQHIEKVKIADSRQKDGDDEQIRPPLGEHLLYA